MNPATASTVSVTFPAGSGFTRIGRVTIGGLALRAGVGVAATERLRDGVDLGVGALGPDGRIRMVVGWDTRVLLITLENLEASVDDPVALRRRLADLVDDVEVGETTVRFSVS